MQWIWRIKFISIYLNLIVTSSGESGSIPEGENEEPTALEWLVAWWPRVASKQKTCSGRSPRPGCFPWAAFPPARSRYHKLPQAIIPSGDGKVNEHRDIKEREEKSLEGNKGHPLTPHATYHFFENQNNWPFFFFEFQLGWLVSTPVGTIVRFMVRPTLQYMHNYILKLWKKNTSKY